MAVWVVVFAVFVVVNLWSRMVVGYNLWPLSTTSYNVRTAYGWPCVYRAESWNDEWGIFRQPTVSHLMFSSDRELEMYRPIHLSLPALAVNLGLAACILVLLTCGLAILKRRQFNLRMLLLVTCTVAVLLAFHNCARTLHEYTVF